MRGIFEKKRDNYNFKLNFHRIESILAKKKRCFRDENAKGLNRNRRLEEGCNEI